MPYLGQRTIYVTDMAAVTTTLMVIDNLKFGQRNSLLGYHRRS